MNQLVYHLLHFAWQRRTRWVVAWLTALTWAGFMLYFAWICYDQPQRADGNSGHTNIDFGGQWLMGAMLARGHGQHLYDRYDQWSLLQQAYPRTDEVPIDQRKPEERDAHDAENMIGWLMSHKDSPEAMKTVGSCLTPLAASDAPGALLLVAAGQQEWTPDRMAQVAVLKRGGPLYPPINSLFYYPLGRRSPPQAYRIFQVVGVLLTFLAGLGLSWLSQGRVWWPVAVIFLFIYPAYANNLKLGQNAFVTLTILIWGWTLIARGRPGWGGVVWGLLAFKPVWAAAFFLVPLVTGRWRVCLSMLATGAALAALSLPLVGWHSWEDWFGIGKDAAELYNIDHNWVFLSRDLLGLPRRFLLDFSLPLESRDRPWAGRIGWSLWGTVVGATILLTLLRRKEARACTGPVAAFLLLGAWISCFHFMYYDVLVSALPVFLLFTEPGQYLEPHFLGRVPPELQTEVVNYGRPSLSERYPPPMTLLLLGVRNFWVVNRMMPNLFILLLVIEYVFPMLDIPVYVEPPGQPWDTYCLIVVWLWSGWLWLRSRRAGGVNPLLTSTGG